MMRAKMKLAILKAVLSTNVLERIPDLELRGSVAAWPGFVDKADTEFQRVHRTVQLMEDRLIEVGIYPDWNAQCWNSPVVCDVRWILTVVAEDEQARQIIALRSHVLYVWQLALGELVVHVELVLAQLPPGD